MDEMMRGQRGWRELSALGDKINKFGGMIEGLIWSPRGSDSKNEDDDWALEEVHMQWDYVAIFFLQDQGAHNMILLNYGSYLCSILDFPKLCKVQQFPNLHVKKRKPVLCKLKAVLSKRSHSSQYINVKHSHSFEVHLLQSYA
jgi:hypothetical protein